MDIDTIDAHLHVGKAGLCCKPLNVGFARTLARRAKTGCGFLGYEASKRVPDGAMISADAVPYAQRQAASAVDVMLSAARPRPAAETIRVSAAMSASPDLR